MQTRFRLLLLLGVFLQFHSRYVRSECDSVQTVHITTNMTKQTVNFKTSLENRTATKCLQFKLSTSSVGMLTILKYQTENKHRYYAKTRMVGKGFGSDLTSYVSMDSFSLISLVYPPTFYVYPNEVSELQITHALNSSVTLEFQAFLLCDSTVDKTMLYVMPYMPFEENGKTGIVFKSKPIKCSFKIAKRTDMNSILNLRYLNFTKGASSCDDSYLGVMFENDATLKKVCNKEQWDAMFKTLRPMNIKSVEIYYKNQIKYFTFAFSVDYFPENCVDSRTDIMNTSTALKKLKFNGDNTEYTTSCLRFKPPTSNLGIFSVDFFEFFSLTYRPIFYIKGFGSNNYRLLNGSHLWVKSNYFIYPSDQPEIKVSYIQDAAPKEYRSFILCGNTISTPLKIHTPKIITNEGNIISKISPVNCTFNIVNMVMHVSKLELPGADELCSKSFIGVTSETGSFMKFCKLSQWNTYYKSAAAKKVKSIQLFSDVTSTKDVEMEFSIEYLTDKITTKSSATRFVSVILLLTLQLVLLLR